MSESKVATLSELEDGQAKRIEVDGRALCLVRLGEVVHAIGDVCSHEDFSLAEGEVDREECAIECWKHGSLFSLVTGEPLTLPATRPVAVYRAHLDGDDVVVDLPEAATESGR